MNMFFEFSQNNSGGSFDVNDKLCHQLFIEANSRDAAVEIAESLGCYWNGVEEGNDCECCGDRWHRPWDGDGVTYPYKWGDMIFNNVEEHAQYFANGWGGWTTPDSRIFYADGSVREIFKNTED